MSLKKKYLKVFQAGFNSGIKSTNNDTFNGGTYGYSTEDHEDWEKRYKLELEIAMRQFMDFMAKERV